MSIFSRLFLLILLGLALYLNGFWSNTAEISWLTPVVVKVYPINADERLETQRYINTLTSLQFSDLTLFFNREAQKYRLALKNPIKVSLQPQPKTSPPVPPDNPSILENILWGARMRYWVWSEEADLEAEKTIRVYLRLYSADSENLIRHSLGLQKGLIGVVNGIAEAEQQGLNNLIAAHELLHTLGATDKYDVKTNWPIWPIGYAEPTKEPLLPQSAAEIMGGRVQISSSIALLPPNLDFAVIGAATAIEIGWMK